MKMFVLVLASLLTAGPARADGGLRPRPLDPSAVESYERGLEASPLVRALVERLEQSNLVVHIQTVERMPGTLAGSLHFVTSRGGYRYVRITLARDLSPMMRAAVLGHELQHACEVAASTADTPDEVRSLFEQLSGHGPGPRKQFETAAAIDVGRQVFNEVRAPRHGSRATIAGTQ